MIGPRTTICGSDWRYVCVISIFRFQYVPSPLFCIPTWNFWNEMTSAWQTLSSEHWKNLEMIPVEFVYGNIVRENIYFQTYKNHLYLHKYYLLCNKLLWFSRIFVSIFNQLSFLNSNSLDTTFSLKKCLSPCLSLTVSRFSKNKSKRDDMLNHKALHDIMSSANNFFKFSALCHMLGHSP